MIPATWQARQQQPSRTTTAHVRSVFASNGEIDSQGIDKAIINAVMAAAEKEQAQSQPQSKGDGKAKDDDGPSGPRDFYSVNAADEELAEAQERYAQARARRERFLMEAQANFRQMAEKADEELQAFVDQEEAMAQALELRVKEVKEVKEEVSALVKEADELMGGGKKIMALFDVVSTLSFLVVLDTFYVSYLAYRGSELLTTSLATEVILGGFLFFKIKQRETALLEKEGNKSTSTNSKNISNNNSNNSQQRRI
ncbi:Hypothetical protein NocV09_00503070 [Nannochloropsis oceanica]